MRGNRLVWILCFFAISSFAAAAIPSKESLAPSLPRFASGPASAYIESAITDNGQFTFGIPGGAILLYGHPSPWSSFSTIQVDGANYDNDGQDFGAVIQPSTTSGLVNTGIWRVGDIEVQQIITLVKGYSTNKEDTYLITYHLVNRGSVSHEVGARVMFDTDLAGNDGAPFQVPETGSVTMSQTWAGDKVPPYFFVFNDLNNPEVTAQASLLGGEIAVAPDKLVIAPWGCGSAGGGLYRTPWDYSTDTPEIVTCDSAYAVFWLPVTLAPAASVDFSTYYGLGGIEVDKNPPLLSSTIAPIYLDCVSVMTPNPFTISLYIENSLPEVSGTVTGITATLSLPAGLRVAPGSEIQSVADMDHGTSNLLAWNVVADGTARGNLSYSISVTSTAAGTKTLYRTISIPAGCPTGDLAPVVGMLNPPAGSTLACEATFQASVWDDQPGTSVQYFVNGVAVSDFLTSPPFTWAIDIGSEVNGSRQVQALAKDSAGQVSKSNKISFTVANPSILDVVYTPQGSKIKVYGNNLAEGQKIALSGAPQETRFKTEYLPIYSTDFSTFNRGTWTVDGTVLVRSRTDKTHEILMEPAASIARQVATSGFERVKINFTYSYTNMDEGEGILLEYSTTGIEGPWKGAYSDLSYKANGSSAGWRKGTFLFPAAAWNNSQFAFRFTSVRTQNHLGTDGILKMENIAVVSIRDYLMSKKIPKIGPAQTVPLTIQYGTCTTLPFLYTRP